MFRLHPIFLLPALLGLIFLPFLCAAADKVEGEEGFTQLLAAENVEMLALDRDEFWRLTVMLRIASREVDALFGVSGVPRRKLSVLVMEREFAESEYRGSDIPVRVEEGVPATMWRLCRGLLERRAAEMVGASRKSRSQAIDALAAALTNRMVYDGKGGYGAYRQDYRIPERQFQKRCFPELEKLLLYAVPPEYPVLFRIYLVHCDLLFQCVADATGNFPAFLERWLRAQSEAKIPPGAAMASVLPPGIFRTGENLQAWYERSAMEQVGRGMFRNSPEEIVRELEDLTSLPVLDASSSGGVRRVPLEKVPRLLEDYRMDEAALTELQKKLLRLKTVAPLLMQDAVDAYIAAVEALRNGRRKDFNRQLKQGRKQLADSIEMMKRIDGLLDAAEAADDRKNSRRNENWREIIENTEKLRAPLEKNLKF
ncbi:MAG: hypothetical protein J6R85_04810 [Lentisphaeria bacterium]|nr:hypothetical protein [Lentisphaeria bacterium]